MKKKKYIIVCSALLLALGVGVTFAFLQQRSNSLTNTFKVAEVDTEIDEPPMTNDGKDILKKPSVVNTGESDAIVRVRCLISPENEILKEKIDFNLSNDGYQIPDEEKDKVIEGHWQLCDDGYYYYQGVIPKGKKTEPLFTKISGVVKQDKDGNYTFNDGIEPFEITIYQESVQATITEKDGSKISAIDENGKYDQTEAMKIWEKFNSTKITK